MRTKRIGSALLALAIAHVAHAQQVRGTVRDSADGTPVAGAVVQLLDSLHRPMVRTIADQHGSFRLDAIAGVRRVQVLRIGYRPREQAIDPATSADQVIDFAMARLPTRLEAVRVTENRNCPKRADGGEALALWEDARAGLLATIVGREARPAKFRLIEFTRRTDVSGRPVSGQVVNILDAEQSRSFFAVRAASAFAALGFMDHDSAGRVTYYGPDADVLLDPEFANTHCFGIADGDRAHAGQTGLSFTPARGRDNVVEVQGALWIDRTAAALRSLEFRFTGLDRAAMRAASGGEEHFLALANGLTIIDTWSIRSPHMVLQIPFGHAGAIFQTVREMDETGGQLVSAQWGDGFAWHAELPVITGRVVDAFANPAPGQLVFLDTTNYVGVTDSTGAFTIPDVLPGFYPAYATNQGLGRFRVALSDIQQVAAHGMSTPPVMLTVKSVPEAMEAWCGRRLPIFSVVLVGRVVQPDNGRPPPLDVRAEWWVQTPKGESRSWVQVATDSTGKFRLCGVPLDGGARLRLSRNGALLSDAALTLKPNEPIQDMTFRLSPSTATAQDSTAGTSASVGSAQGANHTLSGFVRDTLGHPIARALVAVDRGTRARSARSDPAGHFRIDSVTVGDHELSIVHIGYRSVTRGLRMPDADVEIAITMQAIATALDTVRVVASRLGLYGAVVTLRPNQDSAVHNRDLFPVSGAAVEVMGSHPAKAVTDSSGRFNFPDVRSGTYMIHVTREGYKTRMLSEFVPPDSGLELALVVEPGVSDDRQLAPMLTDLRERVAWSGGGSRSAFISRQQLNAEPGEGGGDALRMSPALVARGLRVDDGACLYVDGVARPATTLNDFDASEIESIEVYLDDHAEMSNTLAIHWPRGAPCGRGQRDRGAARYVVIWLKR